MPILSVNRIKKNSAQDKVLAEKIFTLYITNRYEFVQWLKKADKISIIITIDVLNSKGKNGTDIVYRYLTT